MRALVDALCSDACAGRATGTAGGRAARRIVIEALRDAGLDPHEQPIEASGGANVLATLPGEIDRWVLVAAHYHNLGVLGGETYRGADDNAAAVAILVETARALAADRPAGRGVIVAAFDAEEPPHFLTAGMGSEHFARRAARDGSPVPLDRIDMMVCMDLVGHALGPEGLPDPVRDTVFALGAERSHGTRELVRSIADVEEGAVIHPADAEVIPPMSDYAAFWDRKRPFLFLTNARSRRYHTPEDTPAHLAWDKMAATARWLERFVRASCARDERPLAFSDARDDRTTLDSMIALMEQLAPHSPQAERGLALARALRGRLRADRTLPPDASAELSMLIAGLESGLA